MASTISWADQAVRDELIALKHHQPFVYGLTNYIAANLSANALLAVGAAPAIGAALDWPSRFAAGANALWINGAALMSSGPDTLQTAARSAHEAGRPWVLDPVAFGAGSPEYDAAIRSLLPFKPTAIRGNASELIALAGGEGGKGVETTARSDDALPIVQRLAKTTGAIVAVSGPVDYITDGDHVLATRGGDARLTQVTGAGCTLGALIAALLANTKSPLQAVGAAHAIYKVAAERAAHARGTGSFAVAFLDELSLLDPAN
ncbi:hydroxyethylthiazole kinase [Pararobbsia silviterrae]|uniref:Hydroxyethylthiazole kinase n=1 Tax=Pararobbsia silviterrae TaxID=1792498 RepID=A0A494XF18_9BURK|nr:hydroxyethylthiazole kinase [Pararobbsia silviterrae]RKP47076.1 hydroxyethylthiazole kinase [Pararobbsia silviterrae]